MAQQSGGRKMSVTNSQVKLPPNKVLENKKNVLENALRGDSSTLTPATNTQAVGTTTVRIAPKFPLKK